MTLLYHLPSTDTTGKTSDTVSEGLWPYSLLSKSTSNVIREEHYTWTENSVVETGDTITVDYSQTLDKTEFTRSTESVTIRAAWGSGLTLTQHSYGAYSDGSIELDLLTGESTFVAVDYTMEDTHGVLMWLAWAILAPIGIMASTFRWLLPEGPIWFQIHRGVQAGVVLLTVIGFIIAVVFTEDKNTKHFSNNHMVAGLIVTILAILQPVNAFFRAHPPSDGWKGGIKPTARVVWEYVHKGSGYFAWILAEIAIAFGLRLRDHDTLAYVHIFFWCLVTLMVYVGLSVYGCKRKPKGFVEETAEDDPTTAVNEVGNENENETKMAETQQ